MYFRHTNKTAVRSQHMICDALFRLMQRKPFQQITVTELCEEAGVGRKTFYRHFELREDVIDFKIDLLLGDYRAQLTDTALESRLYLHFAFAQEHMTVLTVLYLQGFYPFLNEKFSVLLPDTMPVWSDNPIEQEYLSAYVTAGIQAIQRTWVERGFSESLEDVVAIAQHRHERLIPPRSEEGSLRGDAPQAGFGGCGPNVPMREALI